jgi:hypothetical protein
MNEGARQKERRSFLLSRFHTCTKRTKDKKIKELGKHSHFFLFYFLPVAKTPSAFPSTFCCRIIAALHCTALSLRHRLVSHWMPLHSDLKIEAVVPSEADTADFPPHRTLRRFGSGAIFRVHTLNMEAVYSSETLVLIYSVTKFHCLEQ